MEHEGNHATILNLEINIIDNKFIYKLYDKRDDFNFSIVRMPYKCSNIPESIFYSALVGEFLRIARSSSLFRDFSTKAKELLLRIKNQGGKHDKVIKSLKKVIATHQDVFFKFNLTQNEIISKLTS